MKLNIPMKTASHDSVISHSTNIDPEKTIKFARVKEVLGGYSNQELLEILIDTAIESYYDGKAPKMDNVPKKIRSIVEKVQDGQDIDDEDDDE